MTFEQIKELLNDGFTPEQITMLTTSAAAPTPAADQAPDNVPDNPLPESDAGANTDTPPEQTVTDSPTPAPAPAAETNDNQSAVLAAIQDLKKTIQANNILTHSMETVDPDKSLEKAMAEFIRPSFDRND